MIQTASTAIGTRISIVLPFLGDLLNINTAYQFDTIKSIGRCRIGRTDGPWTLACSFVCLKALRAHLLDNHLSAEDDSDPRSNKKDLDGSRAAFLAHCGESSATEEVLILGFDVHRPLLVLSPGKERAGGRGRVTWPESLGPRAKLIREKPMTVQTVIDGQLEAGAARLAKNQIALERAIVHRIVKLTWGRRRWRSK
jgi:hypothetical protein